MLSSLYSNSPFPSTLPHVEILRLRVVGDEGGGALFGDDVALFGQRDADAVGLEELEELRLLFEVGTGGIAEIVAAAL
jgi:hypothetical protein